MIINADKGNIKVLGDIQEFKTSIDPKNLEFITTLLSSNLYSDPEQSFIREIVSNAWDSHVEAGTTDTPVIIRFKRDTYNWEVTIRDFGTGLSPERFQEVYCNIGSSTKRESNEFIGGFGIGRYSSLACTNTVYITSYYEGTAFIYVMVKSGNTITTNLVMQKPTEEKNGVEVTIKNISNIYPYEKALKYIVFFPNVYVDGIDNKVNDTKLKRFNNFAVASESIDTKILLGNVLYPCNTKLLSVESMDFLDNIRSSGIVIKFNVGEISITPNRESIIYSSDTISKIEDRIKAAKAELDTMISNKFTKDYDNLYEYYRVVSNRICYNPLNDSYSFIRVYYYYGEKGGGYCYTVDSSTLTFKGSTILRDCKNFLSSFFGMKLPNFKGLFYNDRFYQNKVPFNAQDRTKMGEASIILIDSPRLTAAAKSWLQENYDKYTIITSFDKTQFTSYIEANITDLKSYPSKDILIGYMYDYIMSKVKVINLDTNAEFLAYKEKLKSNKIPVVKIKDFILYIQKNPEYRERKHFKDINCCIKYIKSLKKGVILANMQESDDWYDIAEARGFVFIRARKEIVDALYELKPTFLVNKNWVLKKDPIIVKLHTIIESFKDVDVPTNYSNFEMLDTIPLPLKSKFKDIIDFYYKYYGNKTYMRIASNCTKIDSYVKVICEKLKNHTEIYNNLSKEVNLKIFGGEEPLKGLLMAAVIVKSKAYRINSKVYNKVKNNKLLRVLCRK